ncbi:hypothetical protein BCR33DRAFT_715648 [Rhizoclosmatium globosum]|uniref:Uncharacterized protein n=1 Tax=Rhizoclosmatium globosum TaxID=329046 RepID=A0A1Y2CHS9_9FUNG|nr:hypothetical protein BCR33DRAFT_715648 [Rhizoclosmatium globosum]|eukprot:ORY46611.1 hypothetical protein BCR33DRAFT_715648 [Rhizoclosmatium globosum]
MEDRCLLLRADSTPKLPKLSRSVTASAEGFINQPRNPKNAVQALMAMKSFGFIKPESQSFVPESVVIDVENTPSITGLIGYGQSSPDSADELNHKRYKSSPAQPLPPLSKDNQPQRRSKSDNPEALSTRSLIKGDVMSKSSDSQTKLYDRGETSKDRGSAFIRANAPLNKLQNTGNDSEIAQKRDGKLGSVKKSQTALQTKDSRDSPRLAATEFSISGFQSLASDNNTIASPNRSLTGQNNPKLQPLARPNSAPNKLKETPWLQQSALRYECSDSTDSKEFDTKDVVAVVAKDILPKPTVDSTALDELDTTAKRLLQQNLRDQIRDSTNEISDTSMNETTCDVMCNDNHKIEEAQDKLSDSRALIRHHQEFLKTIEIPPLNEEVIVEELSFEQLKLQFQKDLEFLDQRETNMRRNSAHLKARRLSAMPDRIVSQIDWEKLNELVYNYLRLHRSRTDHIINFDLTQEIIQLLGQSLYTLDIVKKLKFLFSKLPTHELFEVKINLAHLNRICRAMELPEPLYRPISAMFGSLLFHTAPQLGFYVRGLWREDGDEPLIEKSQTEEMDAEATRLSAPFAKHSKSLQQIREEEFERWLLDKEAAESGLQNKSLQPGLSPRRHKKEKKSGRVRWFELRYRLEKVGVKKFVQEIRDSEIIAQAGIYTAPEEPKPKAKPTFNVNDFLRKQDLGPRIFLEEGCQTLHAAALELILTHMDAIFDK